MKNKEFWNAVRNQVEEVGKSSNIMVLSPRQLRAYRLQLAKAPIKNFIADQKFLGYDMYPLGEEFFSDHFKELCACRVVDMDTLEEKYKHLLHDEPENSYTSRQQAKEEISRMVNAEELTAGFASKWYDLASTEGMRLFLYYFRPYTIKEANFTKAKKNRIVEMYIYALWVYWGGLLDDERDVSKDNLVTELASRLDVIIHKYPKENKPWYISHFEVLLSSKKQKHPILRTVTDMTPDEILDHISDELLTAAHFPDLFREVGRGAYRPIR